MSQFFDPVPRHHTNQVLCYYTNTTHQIQTIRVTNVPGWYFERVVFPRQRFMFEAVPEGQLEIYAEDKGSQRLISFIPCWRLSIQEAEEVVQSA